MAEKQQMSDGPPGYGDSNPPNYPPPPYQQAPQQPVQQATAQAPKSRGGLFDSLNRSLNQLGGQLEDAVGQVATQLSLTDRLQYNNIVQIQSRLSMKSIRVLENGVIDCLGTGGTSCEENMQLS
jgi:hypothetical protein